MPKPDDTALLRELKGTRMTMAATCRSLILRAEAQATTPTAIKNTAHHLEALQTALTALLTPEPTDPTVELGR